MEFIKKNTMYDIKDDKNGMITVIVNEQNKKISIFNRDGKKEFIFKESDPKVVMKIALLLMQATTIK